MDIKLVHDLCFFLDIDAILFVKSAILLNMFYLLDLQGMIFVLDFR